MKDIQKVIYHISTIDPYAAIMLQEVSLYKTNENPTAGLFYDKKRMNYSIKFNSDFFDKCNFDEKVGVMLHEIYHFLHGHTFRFLEDLEGKNPTMFNIAADMSINQFIQTLPEGAVLIDQWNEKHNTKMPKYKSTEYYYDVLSKTCNKPKDGDNSQEGKDGSCNYEQYSKFKDFDTHDNGGGSGLDEDEKYGMYKAGKDLLERALEKAYYSFDKMPDAIKDLYEYLDVRIKKMNYKSLLKQAIRKTLVSDDFKYSFTRPSRRYGKFFKGRIPEELPKVDLFIDCSGSISHSEMNVFKTTINDLLANYKKKVNVHFFHTRIFETMKFKTFDPDKVELESGGTCVSEVIETINRNQSNISFIFTDGYFDRSVEVKTINPVFWLISDGGTLDHPYKQKLNTFKLETVK